MIVVLVIFTLATAESAREVDVRDAEGRTPLMWAAFGYCDPLSECRYIDADASLEAVTRLLREGADVDARDPRGWTPLMYAASGASSLHVEVLRALLAAGADINAVDHLGQGPLVLALENARVFAPIEVLLEAGADVNAGLLRGRPPLIVALDPAFPFWSDPAQIIHSLIARGADVGAVEEHGIDPNLRIGPQEMPLLTIAAAAAGDAVVIEQLVQMGAILSAGDVDGSSPLLHAIAKNPHESVMHYLLRVGADPNERNSHGWSAFSYAVATGRSAGVLTALLDAGAFADATAPDGMPVLHLATQAPDRLQLLIDRGARIEARNDLGWTALMVASLFHRTGSAELLLRQGARVDARDSEGRTALILVALTTPPTVDVIRLLLEHGADIGARDAEGATALYRAALRSSPDLIDLLLDAGADARAATHSGTLPVVLARFNRSLVGTEALRRLEQLSRRE